MPAHEYIHAAAPSGEPLELHLVEKIGQRRRLEANLLLPRIPLDTQRGLVKGEERARRTRLARAGHRIKRGLRLA